MKIPKAPTPITEGITRRFFIALDAIIKLGKVSSLEAFCNEFELSSPRYRETRLTYDVMPNPNSKPSRYKRVEFEALVNLCVNYNVSSEWLLLGHGKMFKKVTGQGFID